MVMLVVRHMWARQVGRRYMFVKCSIVAVTKRHITVRHQGEKAQLLPRLQVAGMLQ
jgi:hypothetical protein